MTDFMSGDQYWAACKLVLSAPSREAAFEDYAATIKAFRANGMFRIDGVLRENLEWRVEMNVCPVDFDGVFYAHAILCASHGGVTMEQLAGLFEMAPPDSGEQALCILEDALCIIEKIEVDA